MRLWQNFTAFCAAQAVFAHRNTLSQCALLQMTLAVSLYNGRAQKICMQLNDYDGRQICDL